MAIVVPRVLINAGAAAYTRLEAGDYWRMLRGGVLQALFSRTLTVMKYLACEIGALSVRIVLSDAVGSDSPSVDKFRTGAVATG